MRLTKEAYGWDPDAHFLVPDEVLAHFARDRRRARRGRRGRVERARRGLPRRARRRLGRAVAGDGGAPAGRLGRRAAQVPARGRPDRHAQGVPDGDPVGRGPGAAPGQRLGRPRALDAHLHRRRRRGRAGRLLRAQRPLRRARARHGGDRQRAQPARPEGVRLDLLHVLRLHEGRDPARRDPAPAGDLRVHARLDRPRRGRADPPADRAAGAPARRAEPVHGAAGRGERDGAGLALRDRADVRAGGVRAQPPGAAGLEPERDPRRRHPPRRVRAARVLQGGRPRPDPDRNGLGGAHLHRGGRPARGRRDRHARGVRALPGALRRAGRRLPGRRAAAGRARPRVGRGGLDLRLGALDDRRRRSGRHDRLRRLGARSRSCTSTSASRPRTWPPADGRSSSDWGHAHERRGESRTSGWPR